MIKVIEKGDGSFFSRAFTMFGWVAGSQLIVLAASPLLTRIYLPTDFGAFGVFMAGTVLSAVILTLRYESAILLQKNLESELRVTCLCLSIALFLFTILSLFLLAYKMLVIPDAAPSANLQLYWQVILSGFLTAVSKILIHVAMRQQQLQQIGKAKAYQNLTMVAVHVIIGYLLFGYQGLIWGYLVGVSLGILVLASLVNWVEIARLAVSAESYKSALLSRYRKFLQFSFPGDVLNALSAQAPVLLLTAFFGAATSGLYVLAERVVRAPVALVSDLAGKSYMSVAIKAKISGDLATLTAAGFAPLLRIGLHGFFLLGFIAPDIFSWVFGVSWEKAGLYLQLMSPFFFSIFVFVPVLTIFTILEAQVKDFFFQLSLVTVVVSSLTFGKFLDNSEIAIFMMSIGGGVVYVFFGTIALLSTGICGNDLFKIWGRELIILFPSGILFAVLNFILKEKLSQLYFIGLFEFFITCIYFAILMRLSSKAFKNFNRQATVAIGHEE